MQLEAPDPLQVPAKHEAQLADTLSEACLPASQSLHEDAALPLHRPAPQSLHCSDEFALCKPALQGVHVEAPLAAPV